MWSFLHSQMVDHLLTAPTDSAITVHTTCNIAVTLSILIVCGSEKKFIKIEVELCENALRFLFSRAPWELP